MVLNKRKGTMALSKNDCPYFIVIRFYLSICSFLSTDFIR